MTLNQFIIPLMNKDEWHKAINLVPNHQYTHTYWYNEIMHKASGREIFLYFAQAKNFVAVCPFSPRQRDPESSQDISSPYGFSGFSVKGFLPGFNNQWKSYMSMLGFVCGHIALHPLYCDFSLYDESELYQGKKTYLINLGHSENEIVQKFSSDHKHRLRQWDKLGLAISEEKSERNINAFISLYQESLLVRNASSIYSFSNDALQKLIRCYRTLLLSVENKDQIEAAAIFIGYGGIADYFMIASTVEGRCHARPIIRHAINYYKKLNYTYLHLGCGINNGDALEKFKERFGGECLSTYALKQIYNVDLYHQICQKYKVDGSDKSGYFPIYWATV